MGMRCCEVGKDELELEREEQCTANCKLRSCGDS